MVKRLFKLVFVLVVVIVALGVAVVYFKDSLTKAALEQQIRTQTGMDVKIEKLSMGLLSPVARIENLTLYNPADFGGVPFLKLSRVYAQYDQEALAHRELRLRLLRVTVAELHVVRNDLGQTNVVSMATLSPKKSAEAVIFKGIDVANFTFEKLVYVDLKDQRNNRSMKLNIQNQVHRSLLSAGEFYGVFAQVWQQRGG